ncbi:hypothetical protein EVAR_70987_1 [Eumeta japonica]|uniref:Uncharacterized protein n=1 Tax=Eumeta variegata TaxID=151549 RepID=A0A4C1STJ3_EUMVA|nr:hypothetical protein EVAR_70987_1 [Eumeta japonica]
MQQQSTAPSLSSNQQKSSLVAPYTDNQKSNVQQNQLGAHSTAQQIATSSVPVNNPMTSSQALAQQYSAFAVHSPLQLQQQQMVNPAQAQQQQIVAINSQQPIYMPNINLDNVVRMPHEEPVSLAATHPHLLPSVIQSDIKHNLDSLINQLSNTCLGTIQHQRLLLLRQRQLIEEDELRLKHYVEYEKFQKAIPQSNNIPTQYPLLYMQPFVAGQQAVNSFISGQTTHIQQQIVGTTSHVSSISAAGQAYDVLINPAFSMQNQNQQQQQLANSFTPQMNTIDQTLPQQTQVLPTNQLHLAGTDLSQNRQRNNLNPFGTNAYNITVSQTSALQAQQATNYSATPHQNAQIPQNMMPQQIISSNAYHSNIQTELVAHDLNKPPST